MEGGAPGQLVGSEIHGFHTLQDLDVANIMEEAKTRWLRPNEIHAILCNYKNFTVNVKPVTIPPSGTLVLFDRKMLRNFRRDGHSWKKKKDGKTVKEAHEHLKVGTDERIHVYYAHGQDNPTFVRRCYWLLDKKLEHIVLVHYRETQEFQNSPATPGNSNSSTISDPSAPWVPSEEHDSGTNQALHAKERELTEPNENITVKAHELRLHELNTLEWDELVTDDPSAQVPEGGSFLGQQNIAEPRSISNDNAPNGACSLGNVDGPITAMGVQVNSDYLSNNFSNLGTGNFGDFLQTDGLQRHDSFGRWMNYIMIDSPDSANGAVTKPSLSCAMGSQPSSVPELVFPITDIAPAWAFSTEKTKIIITGFFIEGHQQHPKANLFCICGDNCVPVEIIQVGVYRCLVPPHSPGIVNLCMSFDGHKPVSQFVNFEYRAPPLVHDVEPSIEEKPKCEELQLQMRLAFLLFSTSKCLDITACNITPTIREDAKKFSLHTASILKDWAYFLSLVEENKLSPVQAKDGIFELMLKNRLKDWILERTITGCKTTEYDLHGQGVIHLCAILGYTWAVQLFSWSGLSLDFRDKSGWTALHWAAYCGR
ncbi:hypothetical protein CRG98_015930 [Punica granatum]|nr:hypothetical protein CRG98_015930 [Punica granatum]